MRDFSPFVSLPMTPPSSRLYPKESHDLRTYQESCQHVFVLLTYFTLWGINDGNVHHCIDYYPRDIKNQCLLPLHSSIPREPLFTKTDQHNSPGCVTLCTPREKHITPVVTVNTVTVSFSAAWQMSRFGFVLLVIIRKYSQNMHERVQHQASPRTKFNDNYSSSQSG